ncbi:cytochrome o ubiquinol oxidase subunit IV [Rhizobium tumorigenes]|uniref:Cytochrome bo(3) ubiquinol oxidase subunit 4 n=1 Tax=Rhizobium tumorigenes TaxID=2041385 RepID=A0AAF1KGR1_9HYPH|nr:cytochrome o ubiquinol oxidase subunit IV [Rhizobium tumorigenes]WFR95295.1 cytochrome o ubiquinol oxidase subunit IV [Rhizobium tumorigenes]
MSSNTHTPHTADSDHGHAAHGHDGHGHGGTEAAHGTFKSYMTGFILSVILTVIPFWLVMAKVIESPVTTAGIVMALGAVQIVVHMVYFLHMNTKSEGGWNALALTFTVVIVVIALSGSLWVMHNLNVNMMPMSPDMMRNMP